MAKYSQGDLTPKAYCSQCQLLKDNYEQDLIDYADYQEQLDHLHYEPKVGDICTIEVAVRESQDELAKIAYGGVTGTWIHKKYLTFIRRSLRELKPGDRIVHKQGAEYIWLGNGWARSDDGYKSHVDDDLRQNLHRREKIHFDRRPQDWTYYPRNENA